MITPLVSRAASHARLTARLLGVSLGLSLVTPALAQSYTWKSVQIRGGGYVSGILFHPTTQNLIYARTDVGGVYRWNQSNSTWTPLNDDLARPESQLMGVVSFAVDPNDANRLYLASGQYLPSWARNGAILRSNDRGATWSRTDLTIKLGGNADGRGTGERLQVDPNLGTVLFLGTNQDGLWKSTDRGVTWSRVTSFAPTSATFVLFDKRSGTAGNATQTIYVGVNGTGNTLYRSTNGGSTWSTVAGAPSNLIPNHAEFDSAGVLYISYANVLGPNSMTTGALWKLATSTNTWTNISPRTPTASDTFGYGAVSVSALNAGTIITTTNDRWAQGHEVWRSTNGGSTWTNVNTLDSYDGSSAPWVLYHRPAAEYNPHWLTDIDIDPFNNNRVLFVTGGGIWGSDGAFGAAPVWTFRNTGLEETVPLELRSPPSGAPLVSALGDIGGFRHNNLDTQGVFYNPPNGTNASLDFAEANPAIFVRTHSATARGARSTDGATTWTDFPAHPAAATTNGTGTIAINANGTRLVWNPEDSPAFYSTNNGSSWAQSAGSPTGSFRPVSDRVNANKFYIYDSTGGRVYVSTNGGASFTAAATVATGGGRMRAVFGLEGNLWLPLNAGGLWRSTNSGTSFTQVTSVQEAWVVGFGRAASGQTHPAIYLWGRVGNVEGIFRSDNIGASWTRINDDSKRFGWINVLTGDPRVYGRVYVGTGGRGILYGDTPTPNVAPTVSIASPSNGAAFTAPASITINANAADSDGTVASVAFYQGSTLLGTDTSSPYSFSWTNVAAGSYSLTARATDNSGAVTTSSIVNVTVNTSAPTTYQAESGVIAGGVTIDSNNAGFNGTGFANFPTTGGSLQFNSVAGGTGGTKTLTVRYALGITTSRTGQLTVNGVTQNITFAPSGSWTTWVNQSVTITLNSGTANTIRFASNGQDLANIDEIRVQ
jgi:hypothetical protein